MENKVRVNGYTFEYDAENKMYECRGEIMYDDDHDEMAEPLLLEAAIKLVGLFAEEGYTAEAQHSEKGWVEVVITSNK